MRRVALYLIIYMCLGTQLMAQEQSFRNESLAVVLTAIRDAQADYTLHFIHNDLEHLQVSANIDGLTAPEAVEKVCKGQPVKVKVKGQQIFVQYKPQMERGDYWLYGTVRNLLTHEVIMDARVSLFNEDNFLVDTVLSGHDSFILEEGIFKFKIPSHNGAYTLRLEKEGFETTTTELKPFTLHGRVAYKRLDDLYMKRAPRTCTLDEVTVTATKVKFFHKGDTLVYDADAFQLAEGSMLDALIRQLPGAELKDDGRILVNGRFVEALLLNGEDFFRGNNRLMLDNLPAYMVRHLKVYEKENEMAQAAGVPFGGKRLVMDVRLKREYEETWLVNAEAGGGTAKRWLGNVFAMRMTKNSRIAAFAQTNNLNETRRPGENTEWTPAQMPQGRKTVRMAGAEYLVKDRDETWKLQGDIMAQHNDEHHETRTSSVEFLPQQSAWRRSEDSRRNHDVSVTTIHNVELYLNHNKQIVFLQPSGAFRSWRHDAQSAAATFNEDPALYVPDAAALLDSIRQPGASPLLQRLAANRTLYSDYESGKYWHAGFAGAGYMSMDANRTRYLQYRATVNYTGQQFNRYSHYLYDYPLSAAPSDFRNRYARTDPNHRLAYDLVMDYQAMYNSNIIYRTTYTLEQTFRTNEYALYRLEQLAGYGTDTSAALGMLPSEAEYLQTVDLQNSFRERSIDTNHKLELNGKWTHHFGKDDRYQGVLYAELPLTLAMNRLDYRRADYDGRTHRTRLLLTPLLQYEITADEGKRWLYFNYKGLPTLPEMTRLLDIRNDANPLSISTGNPDLKTTFSHQFNIQGRKNIPVKGRTFDFQLTAQLTQNAIAMGYTYNRQTGVRHYKPENVNGNQLYSAAVNYSMPLDRKQRLTLRTNTYAQLLHGVDLIDGERSSVQTDWYTERLTLTYQLGRVRLGAKGYVGYNYSHSHREGFQPQHVWDFNYGPTLQAELPWHLQLQTDLTMYSRRGFTNPSANTNDLVWNARVSRHFKKPGLTLAIDGFDILQQLSNYTYMMNSQGRTETYHNSLPSYFVAHVTWHFTAKPKHKKPVETEYVNTTAHQEP